MFIDSETKKKIICWAIAIAIPLIVIIPLRFFSNFGLSNSCLIPGVLYLGFVSLYYVVRWGTFDLFRFQLSNWASTLKYHGKKKYRDYEDYQNIMQDKRKQKHFIWLPWTSLGILLVVLSIVFAFYPV